MSTVCGSICFQELNLTRPPGEDREFMLSEWKQSRNLHILPLAVELLSPEKIRPCHD